MLVSYSFLSIFFLMLDSFCDIGDQSRSPFPFFGFFLKFLFVEEQLFSMLLFEKRLFFHVLIIFNGETVTKVE